MRALLPVLFSALAAFAQDPQAASPAIRVPDNFSIPARLSRTIDTNKCKPGDVVEMKTLEPVLLGSGLIMPENAKLLGKIVGAASRQDKQPSWVLLVMERADWKEHSIPLHAFVNSQITVKAQLSGPNNSTFGRAASLSDAVQWRRSGRQLPQNNPGTPLAASMNDTLHDVAGEGPQILTVSGLNDLRLMQDPSGRVFLISQKARLKLPSGTMLMLRNRLAGAPVPAGTAKAASNAP